MILTPTKSTLQKYGLSEAEWRAILERQGGVCAVCKKEPSKNRLCIDHSHVPKWKKMPPEQRKLYVRGLLCWYCNNKFLSRGITIEKAKNIVRFLEEYQGRLDASLVAKHS